jgi:hypothetical protein
MNSVHSVQTSVMISRPAGGAVLDGMKWMPMHSLSNRIPVVPLASAKASADNDDPVLLRAVRGESVPHVPVWVMRQAGRHMKAYRDLCISHPTFRERSEDVGLSTKIRSPLYLLILRKTFTVVKYCAACSRTKHMALTDVFSSRIY